MDNVPAIIAVTLTGVAMLGGLMLYVIRLEIGKATKDLQPRNGGNGWTDTARYVKQIDTRQVELAHDMAYLRERIDRHTDDHDHHNPTDHYRRSTDREA